MFAGRTLIPAPHGQLEAIYRPRRDDAESIALLLHPHPQHGGTMHNKVIYRSAKALEDEGYETLRFNYRGVGDSSGSYDDGRGETDDALTALAYLRAAQPVAKHCVVLGFSFGAGVAFALAAREAGIDRILSLGTPVYALDAERAADTAVRATFIHGERDEIAPLEALRERLAEIAPAADVRVIAGADHFFTGRLGELQAAVRVAVNREP